MKIAFLTAALSRKGGGVATAVEGLSGSLSVIGHNVHIFALADKFMGEEDFVWRGAPYTLYDCVGPTSVGYAPSILQALIEFDADIVHLHGLWSHLTRDASRWSRITQRPFVVSPHGMLAPAALRYSKAKKRIASWVFHTRSLRRCSAFHATSQMEAEDIRRFGLLQPVDVIPNGITLFGVPDGVRHSNTILSLGRLHPVKGLEILVDAWAKLEPYYTSWEVHVIGPDKNGYAEELSKRVHVNGLKRFYIKDPVYGEEKLARLASADIFVLPSQTENFGLTVLESLMMQTPVIASQGTPWSKLEAKGCGLWVLGEADVYAVAIDKLLKLSRQERFAMGGAGRNWVGEEFAWPAVAQKVEAAYAKRIR